MAGLRGMVYLFAVEKDGVGLDVLLGSLFGDPLRELFLCILNAEAWPTVRLGDRIDL